MTAALLAPVVYTEDDDNDALLMRHAFRRAGVAHPLVVLSDGEQAVRYLRESWAALTPVTVATSVSPKLLLLDLNLPRVSGFDVLACIRRELQWANLLVAVLSSSNHKKDMDRAYAMGANAYFVKPADVARRLELVGQIREQWLGEPA